jgi:hypothetical protein
MIYQKIADASLKEIQNFVFVSILMNPQRKERTVDPVKNKLYEDKTWLTTELETKSTRQIAKEQKVSYKLINVWALNYGLIKRSEETVLA